MTTSTGTPLSDTSPGLRTLGRVLLVEDDPAIAQLLTLLLTREGYDVRTAGDGATAFAALAERPPDVVLLDVNLPGMNGLEICRRLKREPRTRLTPIVLLTGNIAREQRIAGLDAGADDYLTKPIDAQELLVRIRSLARMKRYTDDLDSAAAILMSLAVLVEERDGNTQGHCYRMANYATALGRRVGMAEEEVNALHRGGFLHDIGMLAIPESVLKKGGALEPDEYDTVKSHTTVGETLCSTLGSLAAVRPIIRWHHERVDGSGYPDGLRGDAVPLGAQIMGIVDVYDAVTTQRPYQRAQSVEEALRILHTQAERGWRQTALVNEFAALVRNGKFDSFGPRPEHTRSN